MIIVKAYDGTVYHINPSYISMLEKQGSVWWLYVVGKMNCIKIEECEAVRISNYMNK